MTRKDKTYYGQIDGTPIRLRASKKPDKKMIEALTAMVKAVKKKHGGRRKGSGRKKKEPTVVRRVPVSVLAKVDKLIAEVKK